LFHWEPHFSLLIISPFLEGKKEEKNSVSWSFVDWSGHVQHCITSAWCGQVTVTYLCFHSFAMVWVINHWQGLYRRAIELLKAPPLDLEGIWSWFFFPSRAITVLILFLIAQLIEQWEVGWISLLLQEVRLTI